MSKDMNGTQPKMKQIYALQLAGTQDIFQRCIQYYLEALIHSLPLHYSDTGCGHGRMIENLPCPFQPTGSA